MQHSNTKDMNERIAHAIRVIEERTPDFEYVGGYTHSDGNVILKCKTCGEITERSYITVRHKNIKCRTCELIAADRRAREKEKERALMSSERKRQRVRVKRCTQITFKKCKECGGLFWGIGAYCSDKCRHKQKWIIKDGYRRLFPLKEVYERDNGVCYLCGGVCDWNDYTEKNGAKVYGNMYPSRDHVIPKSLGGPNTWDNIRLAHRICNMRKFNTLPCAK